MFCTRFERIEMCACYIGIDKIGINPFLTIDDHECYFPKCFPFSSSHSEKCFISSPFKF